VAGYGFTHTQQSYIVTKFMMLSQSLCSYPITFNAPLVCFLMTMWTTLSGHETRVSGLHLCQK